MSITEFMKDIHEFQNEINRAMQGGYGTFPPVRILESEHHVYVEAHIPGAKTESVDLTVTDDVLTLAGKIESRPLAEEEHIVRRERATGEFSRSIELPKAVNADDVSADFKDGILSVSLPIREEAKPKKIAIKN